MVKRSIRPWVLTGLLFAAALSQIFPGPYLLLRSDWWSHYWPMILLHATMLLLIIAGRWGRTPRSFIAVPIAFYAIGLAVYVNQCVDVLTLSRHIAATDKRQRISYDPARHVAVIADDLDNTRLRWLLQGNYLMDLAFVGSFAVHILPKELCLEGVPIENATRFEVETRRIRAANACTLRVPALANGDPIFIRRESRGGHSWGLLSVGFTRTELQNGPEKAVVTTAQTWIYPPIPIPTFSCAQGIFGGVRCYFGFALYPYRVGGHGQEDDPEVGIVAELLGLSPRASVHRGFRRVDVNFLPDPHQEAFLREAALLTEKQLDAFFSELPSLFSPAGTQARLLASDLVASHPERTAAHIGTLLDGLEAMLALGSEAVDRRYLAAVAIAATPTEALAPFRERLLQIMSDSRAYESVPGLLVRIGDFGAASAPLLLRELTAVDENTRVGAALGLCRAGAAVAGPATSAALVREGKAGRRPFVLENAAFIALLRIGDRGGAAQLKPRRTSWYDEAFRSIGPASPPGDCRPLSSDRLGYLPN